MTPVASIISQTAMALSCLESARVLVSHARAEAHGLEAALLLRAGRYAEAAREAAKAGHAEPTYAGFAESVERLARTARRAEELVCMGYQHEASQLNNEVTA